ncbi:MAG: metal ABC transporter permease [Phycisphaerae bacterium]
MNRSKTIILGTLAAACVLSATAPALAVTATTSPLSRRADIARILLLRDYNTRVVVAGVTCLGLAAGAVGTFVLLRKRALLGDAVSHATLPGIALAFLIASAFGYSGKSLPLLLTGAAISGAIAVLCVLGIIHTSRIKEDAALGIVLSVFFGLGVSLSVLAQKQTTGHAAGLDSFIYGKAAAMIAHDAYLILGGGLLVAVVCAALFKEFTLLCFDHNYAGAIGLPVVALDILLMALVVCITVIGLQAVGLILVIAMLVIPPAAANFWTMHLPSMIAISTLIGGASGAAGAIASALVPGLPSGAVIVLVAGTVFLLSLFLGSRRGLISRWREAARLRWSVTRQHLLRAMYELAEESFGAPAPGHLPVTETALLEERSWSLPGLRSALRKLASQGLLERAASPDAWRLTDAGEKAAWRVTRAHRLWELYLITHADIAPNHVDRDADQIEHILDADMVSELETELAKIYPDLATPPSPHALGPAAL